MSMESANAVLADSPEPTPMKSLFGQPSAGREALPGDTEIVEGSGALPLREKTERFARDINAKIDALEEQLLHASLLSEQHQQEVRGALEALRQHLETHRHELDAQRNALHEHREAIGSQHEAIAANRDALQTHGEALTRHDQHIDHHAERLNEQQQWLDAQQAGLDQQRKTIEQMGQGLAAHNGALSTHQSALSTHNDRLDQHESTLSTYGANIDALDQRHHDLHHSLLGLSQEHDSTAGKVSALADQVYDQHVQLVAHRNETRSHVRTLAGALVGTTLFTLGLVAYFTFNPVATTTTVEQRLATLDTDLAQQRLSTSNLSGELQRMGNSMGALESSVSTLQGAQGEMQANQQADRENISRMGNQINTLERSVGDLRKQVQRAQTAPRASSASGNVTLRDAGWLASRPGNHYVVQLASAGDYNGLVRYANQNVRALAKYPLSSVIVRGQGQTRHVLLYGVFATRAQAQQAIAALPPTLRANNPWVRQISSVR